MALTKRRRDFEQLINDSRLERQRACRDTNVLRPSLLAGAAGGYHASPRGSAKRSESIDPMILARRPNDRTIARFLDSQAGQRFSYEAVGATAHSAPAGFLVQRTRSELGTGAEVFARAKICLQQWQQFRLGWLRVFPDGAPLEVGGVVAILARVSMLWSLNACRILEVVDEAGPLHRFEFVYGTLPDHAAKGEERFLVEWDTTDNRVWFEIYSFSRPNQLATRLASPLMRKLQRRFCRESSEAMYAAVTART